jgi:heme exporter protein D
MTAFETVAWLAIGYALMDCAIAVVAFVRRHRTPRLSIADAHDRDIRRDASLTARLTSPALARCDQAADIAAGLERRRAMPLPAPVEDDLVDDGVRIGPRARRTVRVRVVECAPDETPTTRGGAA